MAIALTEVTYAIDATDRIDAVGGAWGEFAAANDAGDLAERPPLGQPLWDSISSLALVEELPRPAVPLLDRRAERAGEQLTMCGWCARLLVDAEWTPLDEAVARLGLLESVPPPLSHGICPDCAGAVQRELLVG
jgi:hypothetical protein